MTTSAVFDYIHVPGCDCSSTDGSGYAARLSRVRHDLVEHRFECADGAWARALECVPDGSCLAWLDGAHEGHGWPGAHRDYHLLACHESALRAANAYVVDYSAIADESDTREVLVLALEAASHGAQPDGSFVTRHSAHIASGRYVHTLHAPGKQGPLAEVQDSERWDGPPYLVALRTREEARQIRKGEKRAARVAEGRYAALCAEVDAAVEAGAWVWYEPGQKYGTIRTPGDGLQPRVSARGVCKRARVDVFALPEHAGWIRFGLPAEEAGRRVSLRAMPARVRRLPAAQRAQVAA